MFPDRRRKICQKKRSPVLGCEMKGILSVLLFDKDLPCRHVAVKRENLTNVIGTEEIDDTMLQNAGIKMSPDIDKITSTNEGKIMAIDKFFMGRKIFSFGETDDKSSDQADNIPGAVGANIEWAMVFRKIVNTIFAMEFPGEIVTKKFF